MAKEQDAGKVVRVEEANSFKVTGKSGVVLSGKADIVIVDEEKRHAHVIDAKSGKIKGAHWWQVFLYMISLPQSWKVKDWTFSGEIEYASHSVHLEPDVVNPKNMNRVREIMAPLTQNVEPDTAPSEAECKYCDILKCPDRYEASQADFF